MDVHTKFGVCADKLLFCAFTLLSLTGFISSRDAVFCPPEIPNGLLDKNCTSKSLAACDFRCDEGYQRPEGVIAIVCLEDGTWSLNPLHICKPIQEETNNRREFDAPSIFCGMAAGFLIVCIIYILKLMLKQKLRKMKKEDNFIVSYRRTEVERASNEYQESTSMLQVAENNNIPVKSANQSSAKKDDNSLKREKPNRTSSKDKNNDKTKVEPEYKNVFRRGPYENV